MPVLYFLYTRTKHRIFPFTYPEKKPFQTLEVDIYVSLDSISMANVMKSFFADNVREITGNLDTFFALFSRETRHFPRFFQPLFSHILYVTHTPTYVFSYFFDFPGGLSATFRSNCGITRAYLFICLSNFGRLVACLEYDRAAVPRGMNEINLWKFRIHIKIRNEPGSDRTKEKPIKIIIRNAIGFDSAPSNRYAETLTFFIQSFSVKSVLDLNFSNRFFLFEI